MNDRPAINIHFTLVKGNNRLVLSSLLGLISQRLGSCVNGSVIVRLGDVSAVASDWQHEESHTFQHRWPACAWQALIFMWPWKGAAAFTLWPGPVISHDCHVWRVYMNPLHWTEMVHMSRMIHLLAWAHNPLRLRWIIDVAVRNAVLPWFVCWLWCFHLRSSFRRDSNDWMHTGNK